MATTKTTLAEHLAEVLRHHPRLLYGLLIVGADSWTLHSRPALLAVGAEYLAVPDPRDGQLWVVTDAPFLAQLPGRAMPLKTGAPMLVLKLAWVLGQDGWELSAGWTAAVKRAADLVDLMDMDGDSPPEQPKRPPPARPWRPRPRYPRF